MKEIFKSYFKSASPVFTISGVDWNSVGHSFLDGIIALLITVTPMLMGDGAIYKIGNVDITLVVALALQLGVKTLRKYSSSNIE